MKVISKRLLRLVVLGSLFFLSFASPLSTRDMQAQDTKIGHEFDYYSDGTYSDLVGVRVYCFSGETLGYGRITTYRIVSTAGC